MILKSLTINDFSMAQALHHTLRFAAPARVHALRYE